jgi:hypothetical protein
MWWLTGPLDRTSGHPSATHIIANKNFRYAARGNEEIKTDYERFIASGNRRGLL